MQEEKVTVPRRNGEDRGIRAGDTVEAVVGATRERNRGSAG